jgi:hypothetical protein
MEILVNKQPLEFELEGEMTLGQVLSALKEWAARGRNAFVKMALNGKPISLDDTSIGEIPVEEVDRLDLEMQNTTDLAIESLGDAGEYLPKLMRAIDRYGGFLDEGRLGEEVDTLLSQFSEGLEWFYSVIKGIRDVLQISFENLYLDDRKVEENWSDLLILKENFSSFYEARDHKKLHSLMTLKMKACLQDWLLILPKLLEAIEKKEKFLERDFISLIDRLGKKRQRLPKIAESLEKIAVDIQTGSEVEAMEELEGQIDSIREIIQDLKEAEEVFAFDYDIIRVEDQTIDQYCKDLNDLLTEIIQAFENKDLVLLSDLLEYELSPTILKWQKVIDAVVEFSEKAKQ